MHFSKVISKLSADTGGHFELEDIPRTTLINENNSYAIKRHCFSFKVEKHFARFVNTKTPISLHHPSSEKDGRRMKKSTANKRKQFNAMIF